MFLSFLDGIVHYQDPSLPQLSNLAYLYIACLLSAFLIAYDFRNTAERGTQARKNVGI